MSETVATLGDLTQSLQKYGLMAGRYREMKSMSRRIHPPSYIFSFGLICAPIIRGTLAPSRCHTKSTSHGGLDLPSLLGHGRQR